MILSQPTSIRAIVFDCFGVLYEDAFKEFIEHYVTDEETHPRHYYYDLALASDRGLIPTEQFYAELSALSGQAPEVIRHRLHDVSVLNRQVVKLIEDLKPRYKIAMLSNAERHFLDHFLANHQLQQHFDTIVASSETPFVKPERGIFEIMAGRLELTFPEIVFIDDSPDNTAAASEYGMSAVHYQTPERLRQDLDKLLAK